MAEIKSAIELAMERTKNLVMDAEEKKQLARKDLEDRLRAIVRRFLEGMIDRERFLADYHEIGGDRHEKRAVFADLVTQGLETSFDNGLLFDLLEVLGEDAGHGLAREAATLEAEFRKELDTRRAGIREDIMKRLRKMDISGSAVEPNVVEWKEWKDAFLDTAAFLKHRLDEWKAKALAVPA